MWNPDTYLAFADQRGRPFFDLLARVGAQNPRRVVDLGCGPGNLTVHLLQRWPSAAIEALDSSAEMVASARERGIDAVVGGIEGWSPGPDTDVVVANAALHWVPGHAEQMVRWAHELDAGGWIAVQVPGNFDSPSHQLAREVAQRASFADLLGDTSLQDSTSIKTPSGYAEILSDAGCEVDTWETSYLHQLTGETPVLDWITGSALTPVKQRLTDEVWQQYRTELAPLLAAAYPARPDGTTLFPFRRVFAVAHVK